MKFFEKQSTIFQDTIDEGNALVHGLSDIGRKIKDSVEYGADLAKHKYYVYKAGRQLDLPRLQLLKHDWNKLDPLIFTTYRDFFYGPSGIKGTRDPLMHQRFKAAAELHKVYSPHHVYSMDIDEFNRRKNKMEAVADWWSASKRKTGYSDSFPEFKEWWNKAKYSMRPRIGQNIYKIVDRKLNNEVL